MSSSAPDSDAAVRSVVGRSLPLVGGHDKVTGRAVYVGDIALPRMLHAKVLRSTYAHAHIRHIDVERARRLPGVKLVMTGSETPRARGIFRKDEHILAVDKVRFIGEEVAAVVAVDENTALDALELIRVEYEELPGVFDPEEALRPGAPEIHAGGNLAREINIDRGDIVAAFREAAAIHEATYETSTQYQVPMEPMGTVALADASGRLTVWVPVQAIHRNQARLAEALGLRTNQVRIIQPSIGGSFGGKVGEDSTMYIAARLAMACSGPVRLVNTRIEDFLGQRPRMATRIRLKMGVTKDGRIVAKETEILGDNGAYSGLTPEIILVTAARLDSLYRLTNIRTTARLVYTNNIPSGAFRGFGNPQIAFALESHIDALAEAIGMDPVELRLRNAVQAGDTSVHGWHIGSSKLSECLQRAAGDLGWEKKRAAARSASTETRRRGVGIACALHVSGSRQSADWDGSTVAIKLNTDGRATIITGEGEIGQGSTTVLAQIAAETLGIPPEDVAITPADTDTTPFSFGPMASRLTFIAGNAVIRAAEAAKKKLLAAAARLLEVAPEDLRVAYPFIEVVGTADRRVTIAQACAANLYRADGEGIFVTATYDPPTVMADKQTFFGNVSGAYSFAAQAIEVEVDTETGRVAIVDLLATDDVGTPINPHLVEGQISGAIAQGVGYAMYESAEFDRGRLLNGNLADYTVPTASSLVSPRTILIDSYEPNGPFGAKGGSETPISPTAPAIANAIYDAIGVRITTLPITAARVLEGLRQLREQRKD